MRIKNLNICNSCHIHIDSTTPNFLDIIALFNLCLCAERLMTQLLGIYYLHVSCVLRVFLHKMDSMLHKWGFLVPVPPHKPGRPPAASKD